MTRQPRRGDPGQFRHNATRDGRRRGVSELSIVSPKFSSELNIVSPKFSKMRDEVPHVMRPPSDYIREHIRYTTQPIEEPENPEHLLDLFEWIGWDQLLFSTDYPHWDFDDPHTVFKIPIPEARKRQLFRGNAERLYRLG
ncbi:MAG: amidohydrolase family protein [Stellaceae bacterium]